MLITLGRLLMLFVWGFLFYNVVSPVPSPIHYFLYFILAFMGLTHSFKVLMLSVMAPKEAPLTTAQKIRLFLFGVFELIPLYKKQKATFSSSSPNQEIPPVKLD